MISFVRIVLLARARNFLLIWLMSRHHIFAYNIFYCMGSFSHKLCGWLSSLCYICEWFTQFTWFLPLFQKSYVANIFTHFQALVENLFDRKIKFFQSDASCEIVNRSLLHHFQSVGYNIALCVLICWNKMVLPNTNTGIL
jgi:hypothetical protein